ncbi:NAD(P)H-binding protein [Pseudoclavibacter chungangensis]|uniref:NAD(P)H-binding protein n=1 Tax=Pseudoclavibacter chungangensis TaxID=587635 RepID=A0A7J5BP66_9MICO|nr:NAD(P)H-binding protein [Pseudoclavibacter chungangensis]KAB1654566.1 NAD(P)H-binding protein [Pseudoclavibacter chungangensis]NYJ68196.1 hypothetical protein [Pseudoclavibacter chungangensis]
MTRILILGATGRTGAAILAHLPAGIEATAALRDQADTARLAKTAASLTSTVVNVDERTSLTQTMHGFDVAVNAIRLRDDIAPTELVAVHDRLIEASTKANGAPSRIVTVGGAGALRLPDGRRFWQDPGFSEPTLPRGRAHAVLRDHLEAGDAGSEWAYLIPPPVYRPEGPTTECWERVAPSADETAFTRRAISYADFGAAVTEVITDEDEGTHLISWPVEVFE